ncbi:MAG: hypothetical protein IJ381_08330 [Clostridia bacterium]|nr:hypothetical protein [Clostridia bacterium]
MIYVDNIIRTFLVNGNVRETEQTAIFGGVESGITNIGYDLRAGAFYADGTRTDTYTLEPGDSVIAESMEIIHFDRDTCGVVNIKNSRLRMGLMIDSPVYQPGHTTRIYFRITNLSNDTVTLAKEDSYVMLMFEQLSQTPDHPYSGTFSDEFSFRGLAGYRDVYGSQIKHIERKRRDLKSMEKSIYANVITIITVFIAIFSLLNINFGLADKSADAPAVLVYNLSTLGAVSFLSVLLHQLLGIGSRRAIWLWLIPIVCFTAVAVFCLL